MKKVFIYTIAATIALLAAFMSCDKSKPERWEYKVIKIGYYDYDRNSEHKAEYVAKMNNIGEEGWELVSVTTSSNFSDQFTGFFKRKLPQY